MEIHPLKPVDQSEDLISTLSQMVPQHAQQRAPQEAQEAK
jgi:hypothetical protein